MREYRSWIVSLAVCVSFSASAASPPAGYPSPGEYRIDSDAVTSWAAGGGMGGNGLEQRTQIDGATGTVTTTSKAPDGAVATNVFKGGKPVTWCVKTPNAADVPRNSPFACQTLNSQATGTTSSFSAACTSAAIDNTFRMIDPRTWEHTMTMEVRADRSPGGSMRSAREAFAMAMPGMTAAEREEAQKALAEMPSQAEADKRQADMLKQAEEDVRTAASPEEAAAARQGLQALRKQMTGGAVQQTVRVKERWTLLTATCSSGR